MTHKNLNKAFDEAVEKVNSHTGNFPADVLLRLYAYYKIATRDMSSPGSRTPLINAFKANALFQTQDLKTDEAKEKYVEAVNRYFDSIKE
ncbi:Acyl-CoA-binding protein [Pustulibacterium marinum]|uniref:Acyl-CoA-binding protein n=1 Tax=Pustulibacterium marinum TaxID=1224947 RepID=A0A1I7HP02_9FLAO|nr:acyl-CoA-binding protein [Pustulibacterium marinum]SFU62450.1 Acyl-CoA-binding protein [Pustulibacterium marinum]